MVCEVCVCTCMYTHRQTYKHSHPYQYRPPLPGPFLALSSFFPRHTVSLCCSDRTCPQHLCLSPQLRTGGKSWLLKFYQRDVSFSFSALRYSFTLAQIGLELLTLQAPSSRCWVYACVPPHNAFSFSLPPTPSFSPSVPSSPPLFLSFFQTGLHYVALVSLEVTEICLCPAS